MPGALGSSTCQWLPPKPAPNTRNLGVLNPTPAARLLLQGCPGQFKVKTAQNSGDSRTWLPPASTPLEPFCICSPVSADGFLSGNLFLLAATFCRTEKGNTRNSHVGNGGASTSEPASGLLTAQHVNEKHAQCFRLIWFPAKTNEPSRSHFRAGCPLVFYLL